MSPGEASQAHNLDLACVYLLYTNRWVVEFVYFMLRPYHVSQRLVFYLFLWISDTSCSIQALCTH